MNKHEWLSKGLTEGWLVPYCGTHDYYMTDEEVDIETEHGEVCYTIYRFAEDMS